MKKSMGRKLKRQAKFKKDRGLIRFKQKLNERAMKAANRKSKKKQ